jgi:hypothetical protein
VFLGRLGWRARFGISTWIVVSQVETVLTSVGVVKVRFVTSNDLYHTQLSSIGRTTLTHTGSCFVTYSVSVLIIGLFLMLAMVLAARFAGGPGDFVDPLLSMLLGSIGGSRVVQGRAVSTENLMECHKTTILSGQADDSLITSVYRAHSPCSCATRRSRERPSRDQRVLSSDVQRIAIFR